MRETAMAMEGIAEEEEKEEEGGPRCYPKVWDPRQRARQHGVQRIPAAPSTKHPRLRWNSTPTKADSLAVETST